MAYTWTSETVISRCGLAGLTAANLGGWYSSVVCGLWQMLGLGFELFRCVLVHVGIHVESVPIHSFPLC